MNLTETAQSIISSHTKEELDSMAKINRIIGALRLESNDDHNDIAQIIAQSLDVWA